MNAKIVSRTGQEYRVDFSARIKRKLVSHPGLTVHGERELILMVESIEGTELPEGEYELYPTSGVGLTVRNLGLGRWVVERDSMAA